MMDSFELNKIVGAVLFTVLVAMGLGVVADIVYNPHIPDQPGYALTIEQADSEGEAPAEPEQVPLATLLQEADVGAGESQARKCAACHTFEQGGPNRIGPNLYDVVGRPIASHEGFSYSQALQSLTEDPGQWTFEALSHFIENPQGFAPGTKMSFAGISNNADRADLLVYLRELSEDPVPLPEPPAQEAGADAEGAPAEQAPGEQEQPEGTSSEQTPAGEEPTGEEAPAEQAPAEEAPADGAPAEGQVPAEDRPAEERPPQQTPEEAPADQQAPADEATPESGGDAGTGDVPPEELDPAKNTAE